MTLQLLTTLEEYRANALAYGNMLGLLSIGFELVDDDPHEAFAYYFSLNYNRDNEIYIGYTPGDLVHTLIHI